MNNQTQYTPFSNGTEAMVWYDRNCERCVRAYFPKKGEYPQDKTMKEYIRIKKECHLKYSIDIGFVSGTIPDKDAIAIGKDGEGLKVKCNKFSSNKNDGYKPPQKKVPENQLKIGLT